MILLFIFLFFYNSTELKRLNVHFWILSYKVVNVGAKIEISNRKKKTTSILFDQRAAPRRSKILFFSNSKFYLELFYSFIVSIIQKQFITQWFCWVHK